MRARNFSTFNNTNAAQLCTREIIIGASDADGGGAAVVVRTDENNNVRIVAPSKNFN